MTKEIVVAYYGENIKWLENIKDCKITIYNKTHVEEPDTIKLENVGREMHTYFHHIIENYNNLSDWIFFTQGNPFDHVFDYIDIVNDFPKSIEVSRLSVNDCYFFSNGCTFGNKLQCTPDGLPLHSGLDINGIWTSLFVSKPVNSYEFVAGCIFCVSREQILMRDISFYHKCKEITENRRSAPWEFERMMYHVFNKDTQ